LLKVKSFITLGPEVNPASVGSGVEPTHPRHAQDGRSGADPKVGPIPESGGFGPEIGPYLLRQAAFDGRLAGVVAENKRE
jgi:hypothetical protein